MKLPAYTNFLILIYGLSITAFGIMEIGHETMHAIKNGIHHHEADHHHILEDHEILFMMTTQIVLTTYYLLYPSAFFFMNFAL